MNGKLYDFINRTSEQRNIAPLRQSLLSRVHGSVVEMGAGTGLNFQYYPADAQVLAYERMRPWRHKLVREPSPHSRRSLWKSATIAVSIPPMTVDVVVITLVLCSAKRAGEYIAARKAGSEGAWFTRFHRTRAC